MKNKIEITEDAQNYIDSLIKKDKSNYFRITVLGGGCAGFQYKFDFDNICLVVEEEAGTVTGYSCKVSIFLRFAVWKIMHIRTD